MHDSEIVSITLVFEGITYKAKYAEQHTLPDWLYYGDKICLRLTMTDRSLQDRLFEKMSASGETRPPPVEVIIEMKSKPPIVLEADFLEWDNDVIVAGWPEMKGLSRKLRSHNTDEYIEVINKERERKERGTRILNLKKKEEDTPDLCRFREILGVEE